MKKPFISKTVRQIAIWNAAVMLGLYLVFLLFTLVILNYALVDEIDDQLRHELEHILHTVSVVDNKIEMLSFKELEEDDFQMVTDNPFFLNVYDLEGKLFLRSRNLDYFDNILIGFPNNFSPYYYEDFFIRDERLRTIYKRLINQKDEHIGYIQLSTFHNSFNVIIKQIFWFNIFALPIVIVGIIFLSILLAKKSYRPINKIIELSNKISATNLSERLEYEANPLDELGRLKTTLNSLFNRLEDQIDEINHFTDNASHQLMTPLTAINSELEYILKRDHPIDEYKETCIILKTQTDRMIAMVKTMLIMSRGCNKCSNSKNVFQLTHLLKNDISKTYADSNVIFNVEDNIYLRGDSEFFSIIIQNLINNAIKYSPLESIVEVIAKSHKNQLRLSVIDNGIGISDEEKSKIFQRFYRVDNDDVNNIDGYGLGLSLVKSVTEAMNGSITVTDNKPIGSKFTITVPTISLQ